MTCALNNTLETSYVYHYIEHEYNKLPTLEKIKDIIMTIFNSIRYTLSTITNNTFSSNNPHHCIPNDDKSRIWKKDNEGLFLIIHGLQGHPRFSTGYYAEAIEKDHPNKYEIRVPFVPHLGNCPLKTAADPIAEMTRDYIKENPGKPINIIGHSNGGRIAIYVENQLRNENVTIRVAGIAGVFFGSSKMTLLNNYKIAPCLFNAELVTELSEGSEKAKELIRTIGTPSLQGIREYEFYATANDHMITPFSSCFPTIADTSKYHLVTGQTHSSILGAVREEELNRAYTWMEKHKCLENGQL